MNLNFNAMRTVLFFFSLLVLACMPAAMAQATKEKDKSPVDYVNPFLGTDFFGDVFPGPSLPYALVHASPDTHNKGWLYRKGYIYTDSNIIGFTHSHGGGGGGEILLMPSVHQELQTTPGPKEDPDQGYRSRFSHKDEKASPGYYQVRLLDENIIVELTTTRRAAFHRYTFPESEFSRIILDLGFDINGKEEGSPSELMVVGDTIIEGYRKSVNTGSNIYFTAHFSKPFFYYGTFDNIYRSPESGAGIYPMKSGEKGMKIGAFVQYNTAASEQVLVKVGISYVSLEGARKNLAAEIPHWNFEKTRGEARDTWASELSRIQVEGATEADKQKFYTSVYRSLLSQYIFQDVDGPYLGMDNKIHRADNFDFYGSFLTWDTYRSQHPLLLLLTPDRVNDMMKSVEAKVREYGWLPGLHAYNRFSQGMVGDHMVPIVADAWLKGYRGFDVEYMYRAIRTKATEMPREPVPAGAARSGLKEYLGLGYVAADKDRESVSKTLEFAYDDWCIAMLAKALGKTDDYSYFLKRAGNYKNLWDPETGFMRPRLANGKFLDLLPSADKLLETKTEGSHTYYAWFDPLLIGRAPNRHYTESNAWPYVWAVQQDVRGLIDLLGGKEKFNARLDTFFHAPVNEDGYKYVGTVGTIGQYVHGNQPSHHIAYLYSYSGQPWKTQYYTRYICEKLYKAGPGGLCGNEDMGSLSSWYVFTSIGFYPVTPCSDYYVFSSPTFDKATIRLGNGKIFTVNARNNSKSNLYIRGAALNGRPITRTWLTWEELNSGGSLLLDMGPEPSATFGTGANDLPPATIL